MDWSVRVLWVKTSLAAYACEHWVSGYTKLRWLPPKRDECEQAILALISRPRLSENWTPPRPTEMPRAWPVKTPT